MNAKFTFLGSMHVNKTISICTLTIMYFTISDKSTKLNLANRNASGTVASAMLIHGIVLAGIL